MITEIFIFICGVLTGIEMIVLFNSYKSGRKEIKEYGQWFEVWKQDMKDYHAELDKYKEKNE